MTTPEEKREFAKHIATEAAAVAEVELAQPMDQQAMRGEIYRVHKVHVGKAPDRFTLAREFSSGPTGEVEMGMTSCDTIPPPGKRTLVVLYPSDSADSFTFGGTCDQIFVESPGALDLIRQQAASLVKAAERG
jgi:hypothetical protein